MLQGGRTSQGSLKFAGGALSGKDAFYNAQGLKDAGEEKAGSIMTCFLPPQWGVNGEKWESVQDNRLSQQQMSSLGRAVADDEREAHVYLRMSLTVTAILRWEGLHQGVGEGVR